LTKVKRLWLAGLLAERDMFPAELAKKLCVSRQLVNFWKNGDRNYTLEQAEKMAEIFGKPLDYFWRDGQARS